MNYEILAGEYFDEARVLREHIKGLRKYETENSDDLNLKYRIKMLYDMYLELRSTGAYLMHKSEVTNYEQK